MIAARVLEQRAREAGPWTDEAAQEVKRLRELRRPLTKDELTSLRVLRRREITESIRRRRALAQGRKP